MANGKRKAWNFHYRPLHALCVISVINYYPSFHNEHNHRSVYRFLLSFGSQESFPITAGLYQHKQGDYLSSILDNMNDSNYAGYYMTQLHYIFNILTFVRQG